MLFNEEFPHQTRMPGGTAGDHANPLDTLKIFGRQAQVLQKYIAIRLQDPAGNGIADGTGLLVDLLEHEVLVPPLFRHQWGPVDMLPRLLDLVAADFAKLRFPVTGTEHDQLAVFHEDHVSGVGENRRYIGGDKELFLANPHHHRRALLGGNHDPRLSLAEDADRIGAPDLGQGVAYRRLETAAGRQFLLDEMGYDLGVGFAFEDMTGLTQPVLQLEIVLDDTVMDHDDRSGFMGMGIDLGRTTMGGPAGMPDTDGAGQGTGKQPFFQIDQFTFAPGDGGAAADNRADAGRVVTAVFKPFQPVEDNWCCLLVSYIAYNAAHILTPVLSM